MNLLLLLLYVLHSLLNLTQISVLFFFVAECRSYYSLFFARLLVLDSLKNNKKKRKKIKTNKNLYYLYLCWFCSCLDEKGQQLLNRDLFKVDAKTDPKNKSQSQPAWSNRYPPKSNKNKS